MAGSRRDKRAPDRRSYHGLEQDLREQRGKNGKADPPQNPQAQKELVRQHAKRAIRSKANKERRNGWDLIYAYKYLDSMLEGSGKPPSKQPTVVDTAIQRIFAIACVAHQVADRTYPGQRQPWYQELKAEAIKFAKSKSGRR